MDHCDILSEEQCTKIIKKYAQTNNFKINSYAVTSLNSQMDGLIGDQYTVKIRFELGEKQDEVQFFFKILNGSNPVMFELAKTIKAYEKEAFYYQELVPLLQSSGFDGDCAPKSFLCEPYMVVLQDLSLLSYQGTGKNKPLDLAHCKKCLETLAKFHVEPIMYEIKMNKETNGGFSLKSAFKDNLDDKIKCEEENGATRYIRCSITALIQLNEIIYENSGSNNDFKEKLLKIMNDYLSPDDTASNFRSTILHADLWSNNFLYKYKNQSQEIIDCKLIDFQTIKYGVPADDVLQFILTNTRKEFREKYQDELLTYYYNYFSRLLADRGFQAAEILSEAEFKQSCDMFKLPAKIHALIDRCITFISDDVFLQAAQSEETFLKFLYEERGKFIIKTYEENDTFRELMLEDITELREMLFS